MTRNMPNRGTPSSRLGRAMSLAFLFEKKPERVEVFGMPKSGAAARAMVL